MSSPTRSLPSPQHRLASINGAIVFGSTPWRRVFRKRRGSASWAASSRTCPCSRNFGTSPNSRKSSGNTSIAAFRIGASSTAARRSERTRHCLPGSNGILASSAERFWRCGASNPPLAIRWCKRTICGQYSRPLPHSPGTSHADAPIGRANSSMRYASSTAAGARRRKCAVRGPARWDTPNGCRKSGSMSASTTIMMAGCRRSANRTTRSGRPRAISSTAGNITAASIGATRCAPMAPHRKATVIMRHGKALA